VTEELDGGPVIAQERVAVHSEDSAEELAARVVAKEHIIYPKVVSWFAGGRLHMQDNNAYLDNAQLPPTGVEISP